MTDKVPPTLKPKTPTKEEIFAVLKDIPEKLAEAVITALFAKYPKTVVEAVRALLGRLSEAERASLIGATPELMAPAPTSDPATEQVPPAPPADLQAPTSAAKEGADAPTVDLNAFRNNMEPKPAEDSRKPKPGA